MYELIKARYRDKKLLKKYKFELSNHNVDEKKVNKKVDKDIDNYYKKYKLIIYNDEIIGYLYNEKNVINEIYIVEKYRNLGIATNIISDIINMYDEVYVYVFKDNIDAIRLYKRLKFKVIKKSELSYLMKTKK